VSTDGDLSSRVISTRDFFGRLLLEGDLDDWTLAKEFGDYLVRSFPDLLDGYLIEAWACRHLGQKEAAIEAVDAIESGLERSDLVEIRAK
jgi:hypothetical protein